jgi:hypothetical protein
MPLLAQVLRQVVEIALGTPRRGVAHVRQADTKRAHAVLPGSAQPHCSVCLDTLSLKRSVLARKMKQYFRS